MREWWLRELLAVDEMKGWAKRCMVENTSIHACSKLESVVGRVPNLGPLAGAEEGCGCEP